MSTYNSIVPTQPSGQFNPQTNASGTLLAQARPLFGAPDIDLNDPTRDADTLVPLGPQWVTIKTAIAMGALSRAGGTGVLTENYATGQGADGTSPRRFPL